MLNYRLIADEGPAASIVTYLIPVVAILLGALILGEPVTARVLAGAAVVLVGVGLAGRSSGSQSQAQVVPRATRSR